MSRINIRDVEDYDFEDDEYEDKRKGVRTHREKREVEKKKNWDRETIYDPYGDDERR